MEKLNIIKESKYKSIHKFSMFTLKGDIKVNKIVLKLKSKCIYPIDPYDWYFFNKHFGKLRKNKKYAEVGDTAVRQMIYISLIG